MMVSILDFVNRIIIWVVEAFGRLGIPDICTIFILFALSLAAIVFLARKKFNKYFKVSLIVLCAFILFFTAFIELIMIDGYRIKRGAESFIQDAIVVFNNDRLPPLASNITQEEEVQIKTLVNNLPKEDYRIESWDRWGDSWKFYVHFENGKTFFCVVDAPGTFMRLFVPTKYKLLRFGETEKIQNKE